MPAGSRQADADCSSPTPRTAVTNADRRAGTDDYRTPLPAETRTYELTGYSPSSGRRSASTAWSVTSFALLDAGDGQHDVPTRLRSTRSSASRRHRQRRLIEHVRTLYRKDDLTALAAARRGRVAGPARRELQAGLHARPAGAGLQRDAAGSPTRTAARSGSTCWAARRRSGRLRRQRGRRPTGGFPPGRVFYHPDANRRPATPRRRNWPTPASTSSCRAATAIRSARRQHRDFVDLRPDLLICS